MVSSSPPFSQCCLQHCPHLSSPLSLLVFAVFFTHLIAHLHRCSFLLHRPAVGKMAKLSCCQMGPDDEDVQLERSDWNNRSSISFLCIIVFNKGRWRFNQRLLQLGWSASQQVSGMLPHTHLSSIHFLNNSSDTWVYLLANLCWETICGWLRRDRSFYRVVSVTPTAPHCSTAVWAQLAGPELRRCWDLNHCSHTYMHLWKVSLHWCWESLLMN